MRTVDLWSPLFVRQLHRQLSGHLIHPLEQQQQQQQHLVRVLFLLVVVLKSASSASGEISKPISGSSEWNFDNQGLRSISGQFLCSQNANHQITTSTGQPLREENPELKSTNNSPNRQLVNVITFIGNQIESIEPDAFRCVASELRLLVLTSNEINHIPLGAFEGLHSVQVLLLDNNLLTSIPSEDSLSELKSLRHLNLADNKIEQLERSNFGSQLSGLISLNLAGNPLLQVHPSSLIHLIKLKTLTLSRCSNHSFSEWPLEGLQELRFLHLDRQKDRFKATKNLCRNSPRLSSLILKSNAIERVPQFAHCQNLLLLDLSYNNIRSSLSENFTQQSNLIDLYLGNNQLESITDLALIGLKKLQVLELHNNRLIQIEPRAFLPVQNTLEELNLSHNPHLSALTSTGLANLRALKCYGNHQLRQLPHFKSATRLALTYAYHCCDYPRSSSPSSSLSQESPIVRLFQETNDRRELEFQETSESSNLTGELILWPNRRDASSKRQRRHMIDGDEQQLIWNELKRVRGEYSIFVQPNSNKTKARLRWPRSSDVQQQPEVRCLPSPGPFLPCKDLFDSWWLRAGIWCVFSLAFLGNTLVIIVLSSVRQTSSSSALTSIMWLAHSKRHIDVPRFLVINLAIADVLMAIYLGLLAFVDLSTLGEFKLHAIRWQYSSGCKLAGFLAVLSSELSVFILAIITLERNYAITNAVHLNRRLSLQKAMFIMFLGYAFALAMAVMPLYGVSDYRLSSVCLPLDVESSLRSQIYVITLISINTFSFVLLLGCYLRMYFAIRGSQAWNANDLRIAKRMSILVLTDFMCWMPVIASGLASLFGYHLIGTEGMKILTIFVLPLNSVANPFLYAITTKKFKRDLGTLNRRTRALIRLECCTKQANHDEYMNKQHHDPKLHCRLAAYNNHNLYRNDLLLMSHQHKGGKAHQTTRTRPVGGGAGTGHNTGAVRRNQARLAAAATTNRTMNRSATPQQVNQTCITCSCQQRRQDQLQQQQQQPVHLGPRIVLETATQTSQQLPAVMVLKKSRSTSSGLTTKCLRHDEQQSPSISQLIKGLRQDDNMTGTRRARMIRTQEAPAGGVLTKLDESMMITGDELSLYWKQPGSIDSLADDLDGINRKPPLTRSAANSLLVQQQRGAAASRSYLSVDPFQAGGPNIRSVSACGQLAGCRVVDSATTTAYNKCQRGSNNNKPTRHVVGGSCDTVRVTGDGDGGGGSAIKLSRSIQRLLFGPLAKAWSSIQISLNSSAATHLGQQQQQQQQSPNQEHSNQAGSLNRVGQILIADSRDGIGAISGGEPLIPNGDCFDDILMMSSPLKRSMRIGERKMSRSCDAIRPKQFHSDLIKQSLNSPGQSSAGQEQSSSSQCEYDDDQRVLLATINRLAAGSRQRTKLATSGDTNQLMMRGRCKRCRSWSPALLTKLENCVYQMRSKISSGFVTQNVVGATRLESLRHCNELYEQSGQESCSGVGQNHHQDNDEAISESESESEIGIEIGGVDEEDDDADVLDLNMDDQNDEDDQFGAEPPDSALSRRYTIGRTGHKIRGRLRQQSSVNSDTFSTRTAGTLMTNMSLSSGSNASIQLLAVSTSHQPTRLDVITDTQDGDDI